MPWTVSIRGAAKLAGGAAFATLVSASCKASTGRVAGESRSATPESLSWVSCT